MVAEAAAVIATEAAAIDVAESMEVEIVEEETALTQETMEGKLLFEIVAKDNNKK